MWNFFKKKSAPATATTQSEYKPSQVVPRVKHLNFLEGVKPLLAEVERRGGDPIMQAPVTRPLAGDLLVTYSFDTPAAFISISRQAMMEVGLDADSLHQVAIKNLEQILSEGIPIMDLHMFKTIGTGQHLEACTLLIPWFWEQLAATAVEDLLMVVPSRDMVYFMGSEQRIEQNSSELTAQQIKSIMCSAALAELAGQQVHGLSKHVFVWKNGWHVHGLLDDSPTSA